MEQLRRLVEKLYLQRVSFAVAIAEMARQVQLTGLETLDVTVARKDTNLNQTIDQGIVVVYLEAPPS